MEKSTQLQEIRITGVSPKLHSEIKNIAKYDDVTISQLLKPHLRRLVESYPKHARIPEEDQFS